MDRLEALADALMKLNGWADPASQSYRNRNPLLLRAYSLTRRQEQDEQGVRVFASLPAGYYAGLNDLFEKCGGRSRAKLLRGQPLKNLLAVYGAGHPVVRRRVICFLRAAIPEAAGEIGDSTPLDWFLQSSATPAETARRLRNAEAMEEAHD